MTDTTATYWIVDDGEEQARCETFAEAVRDDFVYDSTGHIYECTADGIRTDVTEQAAYYWAGWASHMGSTHVPTLYQRWLGTRVNGDPVSAADDRAEAQREVGR